MTLEVGTNSYVTVAEADAYFADLYDRDKWASEANKEGALISATQQLDLLCDWYGWKSDADQVLEFPRVPDADPVPQAVKDAQCEIAYAIIDAGSVSTEGGDPLAELKAGSVTLKFDPKATSNPIINDLTIKLLAPYGRCSFGGSVRLERN